MQYFLQKKEKIQFENHSREIDKSNIHSPPL